MVFSLRRVVGSCVLDEFAFFLVGEKGRFGLMSLFVLLVEIVLNFFQLFLIHGEII